MSGVADRRRVTALVAAFALTGTLALAGCGSTPEPPPGAATGIVVGDDDGLEGAVLTEPYTLPEGSLTDTAEESVDLRAALAPDPDTALTLVFFGYTLCPDICQAVMADLTSAMNRLSAEEAARLQVWFVTTDPARDDAATLREYLDRFDPSFEGFTGDLDEIVRIANGVKVAIEDGPKLPSGGYEVTHSTPILGIRPDGTVPVLWTEGTSASALASDLTTILSDGLPDLSEETP